MRPTFSTITTSLLAVAVVCGLGAIAAYAQTADTGAITGAVVDPTNAVVPGVEVKATNQATGVQRTATTGADGVYRIVLLPPGLYRVDASREAFKTASRSDIAIRVTEAVTFNIALEVGAQAETITVEAAAALVQAEKTALGRVVDETQVTALPLVTRNYQHLMALSPGVIADVPDAGDIGRGSLDVLAHGARATDNNFMMDGVQVNNFHSNRASGVAVPAPDTIEEFKVQTALWDAGYGRQPGANVSIVTKAGGSEFHGAVFEFLRNEALNATPFFINRTGGEKPVLRQNQFGFTVGGPIVREKFHFFGSYQGTRQRNGLSSVSLKSVFLPPGVNEQAMPVRDRTALGALFGGQSGFFGGVAVAADGSNIHPIALAILNARLPDGSLLIPNPQVILPNGQGFSTYSIPARWTEDQFMVNLDYIRSEKNKLSGRFFFVDNPRFDSLAQGNVPGGARETEQAFRNFSLKHTYVVSPTFYHEARLGVHRTTEYNNGISPLDPASVGLIIPNPDLPHFPTMSITGSWSIGTPTTSNNRQTTINVGDSISYVRGRHVVRAGFDLSRVRDNFDLKQLRHGSLSFLSWPDFLLGLNSTQNGSAFSNLSSAQYLTGITDRALRVTDWAAYVQDDWKVHQQVTLNLGLRLERMAFPSELHGKLVNLWADFGLPDPPPAGTLSGFVAPQSYVDNFGPVPGDAMLVDNNCSLFDCAHNAWGPRIGLALRPLARTSRLVLRTGYGIFYTRLHGNNQLQLVTNMPFIGHFRLFGSAAAGRSLDDPWAPSPPSGAYPIWHFRVPGDIIDLENISPDFEPSIVQQWSMNIQLEFLPSYMLEVAYVGAKGDHIFGFRQPSMPLLASPSNPIRGETTNTIQNILLRVPWLGYSATGILEVHSSGKYFHNGLEVSVTKRFSQGLQFLVSYTLSQTLDDTHRALASATFGGWISNDQRNVRQAWGPADFSRRHRLVASYLYELPGPSDRTGLVGKLLNGWAVSGVTTIQSGMNLTVTDSRSGNIFGWPRFDTGRAELAPGATGSDVTTSGSVNSRLDNYFDPAAFVNPAPIGNGFDFGGSPRGIARGPDQRNFDIAIGKKTYVGWLRENSNLEFRAEFFNAFNTPQFANPVDNRASSSFGRISSTIVGPRVMQFALKFNF